MSRHAENKRRLARIRSNGGHFNEAVWKELCKWWGNQCLYPGCRETENLVPCRIIPASKGGSSDVSNFQLLCLKHCGMKRDQIVDYRGDKKIL